MVIEETLIFPAIPRGAIYRARVAPLPARETGYANRGEALCGRRQPRLMNSAV